MSSEPTLSELKEKLSEEQELYADLLSRLDALARIRAPYDEDETLAPLLEDLNQSGALTPPETTASRHTGLKGIAHRFARRFVEPEIAGIAHALEAQRAFNSNLVRFLNRFAETVNRTAAAHAEFTSTLVGFAQRIDRLADSKDRLYASLGNTRADLLLEAMDKRLETVRLGVRTMQHRVEGMDTSLTVARAELRGLDERIAGNNETPVTPPSPALSTNFEAEHYLAFEEKFRGSSDELRARLRDYVPYFEGRAPVLDLGCGRGEFLELLTEAGVDARGIDGNREMIHTCRDKGLVAEVGDIIAAVSNARSGEAGGIFAAQVIEHLPPTMIRKFLGDGYRVLRGDGRIVLETVNPESVVAFVAFYRDLTHQKPLHPETLDFMLRAVGFREVEIRYSSPVSERARLLSVADGSDTLNRNFEKLNALLYGDLDYAVIGTK